MTKSERAHILSAFHPSTRVRITRNGEVHCYGETPGNEARTGWYFAGFVDDVLDRLKQQASDDAWCDYVPETYA
ncbi:MAG: hypothetical protein WCI05_02890 [Myxococcales bacterium]